MLSIMLKVGATVDQHHEKRGHGLMISTQQVVRR